MRTGQLALGTALSLYVSFLHGSASSDDPRRPAVDWQNAAYRPHPDIVRITAEIRQRSAGAQDGRREIESTRRSAPE